MAGIPAKDLDVMLGIMPSAERWEKYYEWLRGCQRGYFNADLRTEQYCLADAEHYARTNESSK